MDLDCLLLFPYTPEHNHQDRRDLDFYTNGHDYTV
jgi:hypothetical protein